jgi:hypothetical protein
VASSKGSHSSSGMRICRGGVWLGLVGVMFAG